MKITLIQSDVIFGKPEENFRHMDRLIRQSLKNSPDVVVLPELWTTGYDLSHLDDIADHEGKNLLKVAGRWAETNHIYVVAGSTAVKKKQKIYNMMTVFDRTGTCVKTYSKTHLFRLMNEEKFLTAGDRDGLFQIDSTPAAGLICYDIRFPEWVRRHILSGAKILFVAAEWPKQRLDHWRTLLICRAIENQAFVVACNRSGKDPDNLFAGHSLVIGPWGDILAEAGEDPCTLTVDLDLESVSDVRSRIPVFEDRRPEIY